MELILAPGRAEKNYWGDLWRYRELFLILVWRDLAVRYKQTAVGVAWAVIRPLMTVAVFTVLFGKVAQLRTPGTVPYALLGCAGALPWQFFPSGLSEASNSLIASATLISKVYFPRLLIPAGAVMTGLVDLLLSFGMLLGLFVWMRFCPDWRVLTLPLFLLLAAGAALGAGLWLCALTVRYRDFRYIVPFILQFGFFISPVGIESALIPEKWRLLYSLNPMVGEIDGFRWALLRGGIGALPAWTDCVSGIYGHAGGGQPLVFPPGGTHLCRCNLTLPRKMEPVLHPFLKAWRAPGQAEPRLHFRSGKPPQMP